MIEDSRRFLNTRKGLKDGNCFLDTKIKDNEEENKKYSAVATRIQTAQASHGKPIRPIAHHTELLVYLMVECSEILAA